MICPKCGSQVNNGLKFCGTCGTVIQPMAQQNPGGMQQPMRAQYPGQMQQQPMGAQAQGRMPQQQMGAQAQGRMMPQQQMGAQAQGRMPQQPMRAQYPGQMPQQPMGAQYPGGMPQQPMGAPYPGGARKGNFTVAIRNTVGTFMKSGNKKQQYIVFGGAGAAVLLVICIIVGSFVFGNTLNKFMKAFKDCDADGMYKVTSNLTKEAMYTYFDDNSKEAKYYFGSDYDSKDTKELVDEYYKKQFKAQAKYFWEDVEDKIGYQYKMSYKVLKEEQMDEYDIEELNKSIHEISNKITFKKVKKVTLEVTAKGKTKTCSKNLDIYMSKESGKWLVICTDDMGSISYMIE